ncbi:helix-turn-helix domain-containing protein [Pelagibacterium sediminicola]|uniref:helix-turn-helix domain-containing protein n=1 Tax=Pelagibacterium sediminicola TaxID=2248761 RepID=UPI000E312C96
MALLTPAQVRAELGISDRQLRDLTDDGAIPFINIGRGKRRAARYDPADIEAFKARRKNQICRSTSARVRKPTRTTSSLGVLDFQAERKRLRSERQNA